MHFHFHVVADRGMISNETMGRLENPDRDLLYIFGRDREILSAFLLFSKTIKASISISHVVRIVKDKVKKSELSLKGKPL